VAEKNETWRPVESVQGQSAMSERVAKVLHLKGQDYLSAQRA